MGSIGKEYRRLKVSFSNLLRHGRLNPFPRTRRKSKPKVLRTRPELEICSSLEFILAHAVGDLREVHFVQIGAFDGKFDDPLAKMIRRYGWKGLLVEPQPTAFERLKQNYADQTRLRFENVAIANDNSVRPLYTIQNGASPLASFDQKHLLKHAERNAKITPIDVETITFGELLDRNPLSRIDLLAIDAEGFDGEIIRSIDFKLILPTIIHYEHRNLKHSERNAIISLLASHGFKFLLEDTDTLAYRMHANARDSKPGAAAA